jgi:WD40 repeat protein
VWDLETGKPALGPLKIYNGTVYAVAVGERRGRPVIISGSNSAVVDVWDLESGEPALRSLTGHEGAVHAVAVGERHGRPVIISGGRDGTVRVWDLDAKGDPILRIELQDQALCVTSAADQLVIVTTAEFLRIDLL